MNRTVWLAALIALAVAACQAGPGEDGATVYEIDETFDRGPLAVRLAVDRATVTLADTLHLVIEARCESGYRAELPVLGAELGEFGIRDYGFEPPVLEDDGTVRTRHWYDLEPFLSGDYELPAVTVTFFEETALTVDEEDGTDPGDGTPAGPSGTKQAGESAAHEEAAPKTFEVTTEPRTVKITSLVGEDREKLVLRDIKGAAAIPSPGWREILPIAGPAVLVLAGLIAGVVIYLRRRRARPAPPVPAHEIAYAALERLVAEELVEAGKIKEFYFRITLIVREYIENRFGLRAPEETTEEFLAELAGSGALKGRHEELLERFLEHCDLVKFAKYGPDRDEIQGAFDTTKAFIEETKVESVLSGG